jgi:hypothetical protein
MKLRIFALGAIVLSSFVLGACGGRDTASAGQVAIALSSGDATSTATATVDGAATTAHPCGLAAAKVTFSSILARTLDGKLVDVTIDLPVTIDLLALAPGKEATLPAGFLPPGTYDQLVVVMTKLELTLGNGTIIAVTPPGGGWTAIVRMPSPFTVTAGQTTTVPLKFRWDRSFACHLERWEFHPEFECGGHRHD